MNGSPINFNGKQSLVQKATLIAICIYAVTLYVGYINSGLLRLQGLMLYAMVGLLALVILQSGKLFINNYLVWYGIFIVASLLACLFASDRSKSLSSIYALVVVWIFALALNAVITDKKQVELFLLALTVGSVLLTVYLLVTGKFDAYDDTSSRFGEGLTGNANVFAAIYMIASSATVYLILKTERFWGKMAFIAAFLLQVYSITLSGGRKYFIFPFVLMYFMALQKRDRKQRIHVIRVTVVAVILFILAYNMLLKVEFLYENIGYRFEDMLEYFLGISEDVESGTIIRERMIARGIELWLQSPIFGHGPNMFATLGGFGVYSHNNYVEMLCNHGIVGFLWYYGFYVYLLVKLIRRKGNGLMKHFFIGIIACILVYEYGAISYNTIIIQVFLMFGIIFERIDSNENSMKIKENLSK